MVISISPIRWLFNNQIQQQRPGTSQGQREGLCDKVEISGRDLKHYQAKSGIEIKFKNLNWKQNTNELHVGDKVTFIAPSRYGLNVTAGDYSFLNEGAQSEGCPHVLKNLTTGNNPEINCKMYISENLTVGNNLKASRALTVFGPKARFGDNANLTYGLSCKNGEVIAGSKFQTFLLLHAENITTGPNACIRIACASKDMILGADSNVGTIAAGSDFLTGANLTAGKVIAKDAMFGDNVSIDSLQITDSGVFNRIKDIKKFLIGKGEKTVQLFFNSGLPEHGLTIDYPDGIRKTIITTTDPDTIWTRLQVMEKGMSLDPDSIKKFIEVRNFAGKVRRGISRF